MAPTEKADFNALEAERRRNQKLAEEEAARVEQQRQLDERARARRDAK